MTFSIIARETQSGRIGLATATSDLAVGARVLWGRPRIGGILTQHTTDPRIGILGLELLASGLDAEQVKQSLLKTATCPEARQFAILDSMGHTSVYDGAYVDRSRAFSGSYGDFAVSGNVLASPEVGKAIVDAYRSATDLDFSQRLVFALKAAENLGGEGIPLRSAALKVYDTEEFPYVDLRIDSFNDPLERLHSLDREYALRRDEFVRRALDPDVSYAVGPTTPAREFRGSL